MHRFTVPALVITLIAMATLAAAAWLLMRHGFSARAEPWSGEAFIARHLRRLSIPAGARTAQNPVPATAQVVVEARAQPAIRYGLGILGVAVLLAVSQATSVGQTYLEDNPLLQKPLTFAHIKPPARSLGNDAGTELHLRPTESACGPPLTFWIARWWAGGSAPKGSL
jgi:hypothetical protein